MYRAKETFWAPDNRRIVKGDLVAETDPVVEGREALFEAVVIPRALADLTPTADPETVQEPAGPTEPELEPEPGDVEPVPAAEPDSKPAPAPRKSAARKTTAAAKKNPGGETE